MEQYTNNPHIGEEEELMTTFRSDLDHLQSHTNRKRVRKPVYIGEQENRQEQERKKRE